jgi:hypothetical protein
MVFVGFGVVRYDVLLPFELPFLAENFSYQGTWGIVRNHTKNVWFWCVFLRTQKKRNSLHSSHFFATLQNHTDFVWWLGRNCGKLYDFDGCWYTNDNIIQGLYDEIPVKNNKCIIN